jgi:S-layer protein
MATSAQIKSLHALYIGYFDRAADPAGLLYWIKTIDAGAMLDTITDVFAAANEAKDLYPYLESPGVVSPRAFVGFIYSNLFNRPAEEAGLKYWTDFLEAGTITAGDMIQAIINGALNTDKAVLDNKVEAGTYFTQQAANTAGYKYSATDGKAALDGVTDDPATVAASKIASDSAVSGSAVVGQTFTLTSGIDNITGTANDDTFVAVNEANTAPGDTLSVADTLNGAGGTDTLNITNTQNGNVAGLTTTNIENLVIRSTDENNEIETLDMSSLSGVTGVTLNKFTDGITVSNAILSTTFALNDFNVNNAADNVIIGYASVTGTTDSASISISNSTLQAVQVDFIETISLTNSGDKATSIVTLDAAQATTINVANTSTATAGLTITAVGDNTATKMAFTGSGKTTATGPLSTGLTTLDGSKATGVLDLNVSTNANNMTLTTGSGNDRIEAGTVGTNLTAADTWDFGLGTDTLVIDDATLSTADISIIKAVKNVDVLEITSTTAETTVDFADVNTINAFSFSGAITDLVGADGNAGANGAAADNAALILTGVENSDTFTVSANKTGGAGGAGAQGNIGDDGGNGGTGSNAINITEDLEGVANTTTLTLTGGISLDGGRGGDGGRGADGIGIGVGGNGGNGGNGGDGVNAASFETINIVSSGTTANTIEGGDAGDSGIPGNGVGIGADGNAGDLGTAGSSVVIYINGTINVTGTQDLNLGTISGSNATVDGSSFAGKLTVTGEDGNNIINGGSAADTINGGAGTDTLTGGLSADTFGFGTASSIAGKSLDKITDFNTGGSDKIDFGGAGTLLAADTTVLVATTNVNTTAGGKVTFAAADDTFAEKVIAIQADTQLDVAGSVAFFEDSGSSFVYYAGAAAGDADDQIVELTGVTGLTTITITAGDLTIA